MVHQIVTDKQLQLPIIKPDQPLESILEYRDKHDDILKATRNELAWMAREIKENPWTKEFEEEIYRNIIPKKIKPLLCGKGFCKLLKFKENLPWNHTFVVQQAYYPFRACPDYLSGG